MTNFVDLENQMAIFWEGNALSP